MQDNDSNKDKSLAAHLESLAAEYDRLLTQALATWLFLGGSERRFEGGVEWSILQKRSPLSLFQYLPSLNTTLNECLRHTESSPENTSLLIKTQYAPAAQCGNEEVFPISRVVIARKYQALNRKLSVHTMNIEVLLQNYRAQCVAQYNNISERCQNIIAGINQLLAQQLAEESPLHSGFDCMLAQFHALCDSVNDPVCLMGYTDKLSCLLTQLYSDLEQFTLYALNIEAKCNGRNQLWLLSAEVDFWSLFFCGTNLQFCEYLNYALPTNVILHREEIDRNLLTVQTRLNYITCENRAEQRELYLQEVQACLAQKPDFSKLLARAAASSDLPELYADIIRTYNSLQYQLCITDILNSERVDTIKQSLLFRFNNDEHLPLPSPSTDTKVSAIEINDFRVCRELALIAAVIVSLPIIERPTPSISAQGLNHLLTLFKFLLQHLDLLKVRAQACRYREGDANISSAQQSVLLILQNKRQEISDIVQSLLRNFQRNVAKFCRTGNLINQRFQSICETQSIILTQLIKPSKTSHTISLADILMHYHDIRLKLITADTLLNSTSYYNDLPEDILNKSGFNAQSLTKLTDFRQELRLRAEHGINNIHAAFAQWQCRVAAALTVTHPTSFAEVFEHITQLNSVLCRKEILIKELTNIQDPVMHNRLAHISLWLNSLQNELLIQKIHSLSNCQVMNEFIKDIKEKIDSLIEKTKKPPVIQSQLLVFTYYIAMLRGQNKPTLATEVQELNKKTSKILERFQEILNNLRSFGEVFNILKTHNTELDQLVKYLSLLADKCTELNNDYAILYSLIYEHLNHDKALANKEKDNALSMLQNLLQQVLESSKKSTTKFETVLQAIKKESQSSNSNDIALLLKDFRFSDQHAAKVELWKETLMSDTANCNQLIERVHELLQKSSTYENVLGSRLTEISVKVFTQVIAQLDSKIRRSQLLLDQLNNKCSLEILSECHK
jgi:hypothetical protein